MKGGMQAALGLGVGYLLSRRRKMRLAAIMAATAAGGLGGLAVKRATKVLGSTDALGTFAPQLGELADTVRGIEDTTKKPATKTRTRGPAQGTTPLNRNMTKAGSAPARLGAGPRAASRGSGGSAAARSACSTQSVGGPGRAGGNSQ